MTGARSEPDRGSEAGSGRAQAIFAEVLRDLIRAGPAEADAAVTAALSRLGRFAAADRTYVFLRRPDGRLDNSHEWCAPGIAPMRDKLQDLPPELAAPWISAFGRGEPVHVADVTRLPRDSDLRALLEMQQIRSVLITPLIAPGASEGDAAWTGFIGYDAVRGLRRFGPGEIYLLEAVADAVAAVLRHARTEAEATAAQLALDTARNRLAGTLAAMPDLVLELDADGNYAGWHAGAPEAWPIPPWDLVGRTPEQALTPDLAARHRALMAALDRDGCVTGLRVPVEDAQGRRWLEISAARRAAVGPDDRPGYVTVARDVTDRVATEDALRIAKAEAEHLATHDPLTGLPNRALFLRRLSEAIETAAGRGRPVSLLLLDIDNFKSINDGFGHEIGDALLAEVARRLRGALRGRDSLARLGGDEFTVILPDTSARAAAAAAARFLAAVARPYEVGGLHIYATASIGITHHPDDAPDAAGLVRAADMAMYAAKADGRNRVAPFSPALAARLARRGDIIQALRRALSDGRFRLMLQPKFTLSDPPELAGAEALLRWTDPELGVVSPGEFIPVAESAGLIREIDGVVIGLVADLLGRWARLGIGAPLPRLALNVSAQSFQSDRFAETLLGALDQRRAPRDGVQVEITETALLRRSDRVLWNMAHLRDTGVQVSVDDFGTGYSSLSYLQRLPLSELKIDRSFIAGLGRSSGSAEAIVTAILGIARTLGMRTVAEGVETAAQLNWLRAAGCHIVQGHLAGRPMEVADFEGRFLRRS